MSNTFTILEVSQPTYVEISKALKKAGYSVERDGEINMEGLHLKQKEVATTGISLRIPSPQPRHAHGMYVVGEETQKGNDQGEA